MINIRQNRFTRIMLIVAGTFFVGLGVIGIILPLLPTTPFLLLAAACYAKSSEKFYNWLMRNKLFGRYIKNYSEGKGMPLNAKILSISFLWLSIIYSLVFIVDNLYFRILLIIIAMAVSAHIILIRTLKYGKANEVKL